MFGRVIEAGRCFGDQYLYAIADLATLRVPRDDNSYALDFPDDFLSGLSDGRQCRTVWGGASKGVIFSLLRERMGTAVTMVIDVNSAKHGKYLPGTGLQVQSPAEALRKLAHGSPIYVMNSNYLEEIKVMTNNRYHYLVVDQ